MRIVSYHPNGWRMIRYITADYELAARLYQETRVQLSGFPGVTVRLFPEHMRLDAELSTIPPALSHAYRNGRGAK